jgi:hypothetical protein
VENLSLIIPPSIEDVNPRIDKAAALNNEYSFLKFGKFFKKKSGKYTDSDIPLKALRADPIVTHLAVGVFQTESRELLNILAPSKISNFYFKVFKSGIYFF